MRNDFSSSFSFISLTAALSWFAICIFFIPLFGRKPFFLRRTESMQNGSKDFHAISRHRSCRSGFSILELFFLIRHRIRITDLIVEIFFVNLGTCAACTFTDCFRFQSCENRWLWMMRSEKERELTMTVIKFKSNSHKKSIHILVTTPHSPPLAFGSITCWQKNGTFAFHTPMCTLSRVRPYNTSCQLEPWLSSRRFRQVWNSRWPLVRLSVRIWYLNARPKKQIQIFLLSSAPLWHCDYRYARVSAKYCTQ